MKKYDFCGWATKYDTLCSDGRVISKNAFAHNDGDTVPLVWDHHHDSPSNIIGHVVLESRPTGMYGYGFLNHSATGEDSRECVKNGDIRALSIFANKLKQKGNEVVHGMIREVSLVMAGANPGAYIEDVMMHSDSNDECTYDAIITFNDGQNVMEHADDLEDSEESKTEETKKDQNDSQKEKKEMADKEKTVGDVLGTLNEDQSAAVLAVIEQVEKDIRDELSTDNKEEEDVKHNLFEGVAAENNNDVLMHSAMEEILADAPSLGSLKKSFLAHADEYGITQIDWLYPEDKLESTGGPGFAKRTPDEWVAIVLGGVHHTPFAKIKMMFADLREDDARAKGYAQKGRLKKEEVIGLLRRTVGPTTIYKKQKLDRDDTIDITDFNVVSWIKGEMRVMLDEEIARQILFGDQRGVADEDRIDPACIIPAVADGELFTIQQEVTVPEGGTVAEAIIDSAVLGQENYEGSGNLIAFIDNRQVMQMLLLKDGFGHRLYKDTKEIALAMGVNRLVKVPSAIVPSGKYGVILDLADYGVGADKGGSINMFDDFDIDYNQYKYLIETRCSGAMRKPFSAISLNVATSGNGEG